MKIPLVGADGRTDVQTDRRGNMTRLIVAFRSFTKSA